MQQQGQQSPCLMAMGMGGIMGAGVGGVGGTVIGGFTGVFSGHRRMALLRHTGKYVLQFVESLNNLRLNNIKKFVQVFFFEDFFWLDPLFSLKSTSQ